MPRGKAKAVPVKYEPNAEEMEEMRQTAKELEASGAPGGAEEESDEWEDMDDDDQEETREEAVERAANAAKSASKSAKKAPVAGADDLAEYNLDGYDEEPDGVVGVLAGAGLSVYSTNNEDPYITLPDADDDSENDEENMIRPSDSIILACHSEEDGHMLDVYVYDDEEGSLFVHHDLMLNAFPLCVAYTDTARQGQGAGGNFVAIGTMDTEIEVHPTFLHPHEALLRSFGGAGLWRRAAPLASTRRSCALRRVARC
jgi:periodic tryptophan protein 1